MQDRDEKDERNDHDTPDYADRQQFAFHCFHIEHPESHNKEGQVSNEKYEPRCAAAPPGVIPCERAGSIEEHLNNDAEDRPCDSYESPIRDAEDLSLLIRWQHLCPNDTGDCEHETDLNI